MAISRICNICLSQDHVQNICTNEKKPLLNTLVSLTKNKELSTRKNVYVCRKCNHDIENYKRLRQLCHKNLFELPQLYFQLKSDISDDDIDTEVIVTDFLKQRLPKSSASGLLHLNIGTEDECVLINNESSNVNVIKIINLYECDEGLNTENVENDIESNLDNFTNINSGASTSQNTFNLPMQRHGFMEKKPRSRVSRCPHEPTILLYKCYVCGQRFNMRRNLRIHHEEHEQIDFKLRDIRLPNNLMEEIPTGYSSTSLENTHSVSAEKETTGGGNHENQNILNDENTQNITCGTHNIRLQTMNCIYQESSGGGSENEFYQNENNLNIEISENNGYINGISKKKEVRKNICQSDLQEFNVCSTECSIGEHEKENLNAIKVNPKINEFESHETQTRILRSSVNGESENENATNKLKRCKRRLRSAVESSEQEIYDELDEEVQKYQKQRTSHRCKSGLSSTVDGNQLNHSQEQITKELQNNPNSRKRILRSQSTVDQYNFYEESRKESQEYKNVAKRNLRSSASQNSDGEFENEHNLNKNIQNDEVRKKVSEKRRISLFKQLNGGFENELQQNKIIQEDAVTKKITGRKTPCLPLMVDLNHINNPSEEIQNEFNHNESASDDNVRKKVTSKKRAQHLSSTVDCNQLSNSGEEIQNEFKQNRNSSNNEVRKEMTSTLCTVDLNHVNIDEDFENKLRQNLNFEQKKVRAGRRTPCLRSIDLKQVNDFDGELQQSENIQANIEVRKKVADGRRTPRLRSMVDHNDSDKELKNEFEQNDSISLNNKTNENTPASNKVRKKKIYGRRTPSLRSINKQHNSDEDSEKKLHEDENIPNDKVRKTVKNVRHKRSTRSSLDFNDSTKRRTKRVRSCVNYNEIDEFRKVNLKNSRKGKLLFRKKSGSKDLKVTRAGSSISEKTKRSSKNKTAFQCAHCPKLCKSIHHVLLHQRRHLKIDNEKNTSCKITKRKDFRKNVSLNYHPIATKNGVRLQCVHCPKVCASQNALSTHQIIHSPEYAMLQAASKSNRHLKTCHVCGKRVRAMHLHLRVHESLDKSGKNPPEPSQAFSTDVKKNERKKAINHTHALKSCDICGKQVRMMHLHTRIHKNKRGVKKSIQSSVLNGQQIKEASEKSNYCESDTNLKISERKYDAEAATTKINNED